VNLIDAETELRRVDASLHPPPAARPQQFAKALVWTLLVPAVIYILTFATAVGRGPGLRSLGLSKFGPILDYGYEARGVDADVLIFGDSSAFLGIDPRLIHPEQKNTTAVLPDTIGSLEVTGDLVLRRYLEHNRRPRVLVLYFSPWNLDYEASQQTEFLLEGEEEVLRYGSWADIWRAFAKHPSQFLVFPFQALEPLGIKHIREALRHEGVKRGEATATAFGHWDYTLPYPPLNNDCRLRSQYTKPMLHDTIRMMRERYQAEGLQVAVYLAPIPNCSNSESVAAASYADVDAAPPRVVPPGWFADDSFTAHIRPAHVRQSSALFADALSKLDIR
jgi:hypothetical protein